MASTASNATSIALGRWPRAVRAYVWPVGTALVAIALVVFRTMAAVAVGPRWDAFAFLANAAAIAGRGFGYAEPARPPLISVLAAGPMLAFGLDARVIQATDAALTLLGLLGFWLLVRRRLAQPAASVATFALLASPALWEWIGVGYTDFAAVGLCAWTLLLFVKATEDDPRWYAAAFPVLLGAALMRTSSVLFLMTVGVWLLMRARPLRHARHLAVGVALALTAYAPFAIAYQRLVGEPLYPFVASQAIQEAGSGSGVVRQVESFAASLHALAVPQQLAPIAVGVIALGVLGLIRGAFRGLPRGRAGLARAASALVVVLTVGLVARNAGPAMGQVAIAAGVYVLWRLLASEEAETDAGHYRVIPANRALDAAMLVWLLSFWWFHEEWAQKVTRYYITMAPGVAYFTVLGWRELVREAVGDLSAAGRGRRIGVGFAGAGAAALVVAALLTNAVATSWSPDPGLAAARDTAAWLESAAPDGATIYSDEWPMTAWYLRRDIEAMPLFNDEAAVGHELAKNRADFFVSNDNHPVTRYRDAYVSGNLRVLAPSAQQLARFAANERGLLYLGTGWENYLEKVDSYRTRLLHDEGDYNMEGTAFLDEVQRADQGRGAIAVYGVRWRERAGSQRALEQYVAGGGTLLIDASRNLAEPYSLDGSVLFDTVISREPVERSARITLDAGFAAKHPELASDSAIDASPFIDESGAPWYGAGYRELPGSEPLRVLARVNGRPLAAERRWGDGRVIWLGYNLLWHAHLTQNADEARLIRAILDDVLSPEPTVGCSDPSATSG